jgi:hypothetical protein
MSVEEPWIQDIREGFVDSFRALVRKRTGRDIEDPQEAFWALWLADIEAGF